MTPSKIPPLTEEEIKNWPTKPLVDLEKPSLTIEVQFSLWLTY